MRSLRTAVVVAACGIVVVGTGTAASATGPANDPRGANGTVKIDKTIPVDETAPGAIRNYPHVGCVFGVSFWGFDKEQQARITFQIWDPSQSAVRPHSILQDDVKTISPDKAAGARNDLDAEFTYNTADWNLQQYKLHEQQGYHIKLTVTLLDTGTTKHKVFWVPECVSSTSTTPGGGESSTGGGPPSSTPPGEGGGSGLPITGPAAGGIALAGIALISGGAALVVLRRRRRIAFTTDDLNG